MLLLLLLMMMMLTSTLMNIQAQDTDLDPKAKDFFQEVDDDLRIKSSSGTVLFNQLNLSRPLLRAVEAMGYVTPTPVQVRM